MVVCEACGAELDPGARFCGECGAVVRAKTREMFPEKGSGGASGADARGKSRTQPARRGREAAREPRKQQEAASVKAGPAEKSAATRASGAIGRTTVRGIAEASPALHEVDRGATGADAGKGAAVAGAVAESRSEFQRLLEEVESGFDAILVAPESSPPPNKDTVEPSLTPTTENVFDEAQAIQLFRELVVANAEPIRDFMIEVRLGEPHAAWIDVCEPAVRAILQSALGMGLDELAAKLRAYIGALDAAKSLPDPVIRGDARERIIDAYSELIVFFSEAFALEAEANAREAAIVDAVYGKVAGLYPVGRDRIRRAGLASLGLLYVSRAQDIVEMAGVDGAVAEAIVAQFAEYRRRVSEVSPVGGRAEERRRLREVVRAIEDASRTYDEAAPASAQKRAAREARARAMAEAALLLARLGQVERIERLETMPFSARCADIHAYLDEIEKRARRVE
jgi:hypothetical protein